MNTISGLFLKELQAEIKASRACIERIPESLFDWKPHEKSMKMGYLTQLVAEIPKWIAVTIEVGEVNFGTWEKYTLTTTEDLLRFFDENIARAEKALQNTTDEILQNEMFYLRMDGKELMKSTKEESVGSSLNHWVHHRGQLTVYMRLNGIAVPAIYGPSADDPTF